jgi:hypothetical protein
MNYDPPFIFQEYKVGKEQYEVYQHHVRGSVFWSKPGMNIPAGVVSI